MITICSQSGHRKELDDFFISQKCKLKVGCVAFHTNKSGIKMVVDARNLLDLWQRLWYQTHYMYMIDLHDERGIT